MIGLLQAIVDTFASVIAFFVHSLQSLFDLITHIPAYVSFLTTSINVLPSVVVPFAIASVTLYVVLMVVNRK